jgi:hypothetical protein
VISYLISYAAVSFVLFSLNKRAKIRRQPYVRDVARLSNVRTVYQFNEQCDLSCGSSLNKGNLN